MGDSTLLLTDDGAWCRYFGAERRLHAQHAADTFDLRATLWPRPTVGPGSPDVTHCAAQSPHDQYYFRDQQQMVSGVVRPPSLDLANRDLVEAHLHAVWLAESGRELAADIPHILDLTTSGLRCSRAL